MVGVACKKGDAPANITTDLETAQVDVKRRWSDGSVKHAIIAGRAALTRNVARTIQISTGSQAGGKRLTAADIQAAKPQASVQCGGIGTVNLSALLARPFRTWTSGSEMVECHYRADVGGGTLLSAWFHVRLFADGRKWVRAIVENGYLDNGAGAIAANADRTYVPTITIGGTVVYNNGGASLSHYKNTRYSSEGWIGGDPQITPKHDVAYLRNSKLLPNYHWTNPSATALNALTQTYTPMSNGNLEPSMGVAGFQPSIGLMPTWDALYATSGDSRAYRSCLANSSHLNSYGIVWRDFTTKLPLKPSDFPTWSLEGPNGGGAVSVSTGPLTWEFNHMPGECYLAYLVSGDYWHYETMLLHNALCYVTLSIGAGRGAGTSRILTGETRGTAWGLRNMVQLGAIFPAGDAVAADYKTLLSNNIDHWKSVVDALGGRGLGYLWEYNVASFVGAGNPVGVVSPFMHHFAIQAVGMGSDIEPLKDMGNLNAVRDYQYRGAVGILGDSSGFCFTKGSTFKIRITTVNNTDPATWFPTWAQVYSESFALGLLPGASSSCANTLEGTSGEAPWIGSQGFWGNLMPAIAYAVDHGASGAQASWNRVTGATNWAALRDSGFDDIPNWGITPRNYTEAFVPPYTLPNAGEVVAIGTNSAADIAPSVAQGMDSLGDWNYSLFYSFGGGALVEDFSQGGAFVIAMSGGHTAPDNPGAAVFDYQDATWKRYDPTAGANLYHSPASYNLADTTGSPNYEITGTNVPAPSHLGQNLVPVPKAWDGSAKGSVMRLGAMAILQESRGTDVIHKLDLSAMSYARPATNTFTRGTQIYGIGLLDKARQRWWRLTGDENAWSSLEFLDATDWTVKHTSSYGFPPSPWAIGGAFMHQGLIIRNGGTGTQALACFDPDDPTTPFLLNVDNVKNLNPTFHCAYVPFRGKFYSVPEVPGESRDYTFLYRLTPPAANPKTNQWIADTIAIPTIPRSAGSPGNSGGAMNHNRLHYVPAIDRLAWIAGGTQQVRLIWPAGA